METTEEQKSVEVPSWAIQSIVSYRDPDGKLKIFHESFGLNPRTGERDLKSEELTGEMEEMYRIASEGSGINQAAIKEVIESRHGGVIRFSLLGVQGKEGSANKK